MVQKMKRHNSKGRKLAKITGLLLAAVNGTLTVQAKSINGETYATDKCKMIVFFSFICLVLLGLSVLLLVDNYKKRRYTKELQDNNEKLMKTYEELALTEEKLRQQYSTICEYSQNIEHLANNDHLTLLPNRRSFTARLEKEIKESTGGAILLIDIDDFKKYNDTLGHIYGDVLLKKITERLRSIEDERLFLSRFGGDEFLMLIMERDIVKVEDLIKKIQSRFDKPILIGRKAHFIQLSIGASRFPCDAQDANRLITCADTAMYQAKKYGKNNYVFYENFMQEDLMQRSEIEEILRSAIMDDGFILLFQPQVSVVSGDIVGFEALLRLRDYNISPMQFIEIAEETSLILEIGRIATRKAVEQLAQWRKEGFTYKTISINYSSRQIRDEGYIDFLSELLEKNKIPPQYIEIEITESIFFEQSDDSLEVLKRFQDMGVKLALDDFGTGFSSINYLTYIPLNKLKLDKSLADKFLGFRDKRTIESIILLAHSFGLEIIAEGIETPEQYERLRELGCEYIQGYLFSKPLKSEEIKKIYNCNLSEIVLEESKVRIQT